MLKNIKSQYILKTIFNYIKDEYFALKLFEHSNLFQKKMDFNLDNYKLSFLKLIAPDINQYFYDSDSKVINKNTYIDRLNKDLLKYNVDIKIFEKYIDYFFEEQKNKELVDNFDIDIYSPFFDILIKKKYFNSYFTIPIKMIYIKKLHSENDYISKFNLLKKPKIRYSSIKFDYIRKNDIDFIKELNINFTNIKKLEINEDWKNDSLIDNYDKTYNTFFSINELKNLEYLKIFMLNIFTICLNNNNIMISNLNNFNSLIELQLQKLWFSSDFTLKLYNLQKIEFYKCSNITFENNCLLKLKKLNLYRTSINQTNYLLKLPELEELLLQIGDYNIIFDYSSFKKLKILNANENDFMNIPNTNLEKLTLSIYDNKPETSLKAIQKILLCNKLKDLSIDLYAINDNDLLNIKGKNNSVTNLHIYSEYYGKDYKYAIKYLQDKFPNLTSIELKYHSTEFKYYDEYKKSKMEIKEDLNSKIHDIFCLCNHDGNYFNCGKYEKITKINLLLFDIIINLENSFPLFNNDCKVLFRSLNYFKFHCESPIDLRIIKNVYKNIDKMPNIKYFHFHCVSGEITQEFYMEFVEKILKLNLGYSFIEIKTIRGEINKEYSEKELREIFPKHKFSKLNVVHIKRLNTKNIYSCILL